MPIVKDDTKSVVTSFEDFILFGSVKEVREIYGNKVLMQTVKGHTIRAISVQTSGLDIIARDKVTKIEILSRAIKSINGASLIETDSDESLNREEVIEKMKDVIGKWEQPLIDTFYDEYISLIEIQKKFFDEIKKKFLKKTN